MKQDGGKSLGVRLTYEHHQCEMSRGKGAAALPRCLVYQQSHLFATLSLNLMETFSCLCRATGQDWLSYCAMAIKSTVCENKTKVLVQTADNTSDISW